MLILILTLILIFKLCFINASTKTVALILTETRSGSSFLGEVLNLCPDVFYLYEPLLISPKHSPNPASSFCTQYWIEKSTDITKGLEEATSVQQRSLLSYLSRMHSELKRENMIDPVTEMDYDLKILFDFFAECQIPSVNDYYEIAKERIQNRASPARKRILESCKRKGFCFADHHKVLERHPFEQFYLRRNYNNLVGENPVAEFLKTKNLQDSENIPVHELKRLYYSDLCQNNYKVQVAKVVRMCSIEEAYELSKLLSMKSINLQVFYLARDPRGIYNSRWSLKWTNTPQPETAKITSIPRRHCDKMNGNIEFYEKHVRNQNQTDFDPELQNFLNQQVHFIKYEDLANFPIQSAQFIYDKLNLNLTESIKTTIYQLTQGKAVGAQDAFHDSMMTKKKYFKENVQQITKKRRKRDENDDVVRRRRKRELQTNIIRQALSEANLQIKSEHRMRSIIDVTAMNSSAVTTRWRKNFLWKPVEQSQEYCKIALEYFGYEIYENEVEWDKNGR